MNWPRLNEDIQSSSTSSEIDKACAEMLLFHIKAEDLPFTRPGEWHHLLPLCCNGSVEDSSNYRRLSFLSHIQCHVALAHLFPYISGLQCAAQLMMATSWKSMTEETILECLAGTGLVLDLVELKEVAQKFMLGNTYGTKPLSNDPIVIARRAYTKNYKVKQKRIDEGEILPGDLETFWYEQWNEWFEQLREFKVQFGDCLVPQLYSANPKLGH